jgi:hypothetical protein
MRAANCAAFLDLCAGRPSRVRLLAAYVALPAALVVPLPNRLDLADAQRGTPMVHGKVILMS